MKDLLTFEVKEVMRENAHSLVETLILEEVPFRIVLWNNDNWDSPLPKKIMETFPKQLVLDIKEMALRTSYLNESTGEIILSTAFESREYSKILHYDEIIAVLDLKGQPYLLNNFPQDTVKDIKTLFREPASKKEWIEIATSGGITAEAAERSISAFIKHNPNLSYLDK